MTIQGLMIWNEIGGVVMQGALRTTEERNLLAERLETWFMRYKSYWRKSSKEGDLHHVSEIVFWYADILRGK